MRKPAEKMDVGQLLEHALRAENMFLMSGRANEHYHQAAVLFFQSAEKAEAEAARGAFGTLGVSLSDLMSMCPCDLFTKAAGSVVFTEVKP